MSSYREREPIVASTPLTVVDRIYLDGVLGTVALVTSVATRIFQYASLEDARSDTGGIEVGTVITALSAACMFSSLRLDGIWNRKDAIGYNLKISIPAARFPDGGAFYRIQQVVTPSAGGAEAVGLVPWILETLASATD